MVDAGGGIYELVLSENLGAGHGLPHAGLPAPADRPEVRFVLDGVGYRESGRGGTLASCIVDCINSNDFGECPCDSGETCDTTADPDTCRNDYATTVIAALDAEELDAACMHCYAGISDCVVSESCSVPCANPGCGCDTCLCDAGCPDRFAECSGLPAYLDCEAVEETCE